MRLKKCCRYFYTI